MRKSLEFELKKLIIADFGGFVARHEPARGGGIGFPDLEFLIKAGLGMLPVELKIYQGPTSSISGSSTPAVKLGFRATQIGWHREFAAAGGIAVGIVGKPSKLPLDKSKKKFELFIVYGCEIGANRCLLRPIRFPGVWGSLREHVAYLESNEGQCYGRSLSSR